MIAGAGALVTVRGPSAPVRGTAVGNPVGGARPSLLNLDRPVGGGLPGETYPPPLAENWLNCGARNDADGERL